MSESQREKIDMITLHKILFTVCAFSLIYKYYTGTIPSVARITEPNFRLRGPFNPTPEIVEDDYNQLIDIKNFTFMINAQPCKNNSRGLLLVVLITSNPSNHLHRNLIRSTWGRNFDTTKVVFLVGESTNDEIKKQISFENVSYGDIIQGSFVDAYRNMTYKHVMGLKWVTHHCPYAKYVLKTDDDVVVNTRELRHFLRKELSPWGAENMIMCHVLEHAKPQRNAALKWSVTTAEYPKNYYPPYCAGYAILYSQDVISRLLKAAQSLNFFWIDDVHITGVCAEKIGVNLTQIKSLMLSESTTDMLLMLGQKYVSPFLVGPPDLSMKKIYKIWRAIPE